MRISSSARECGLARMNEAHCFGVELLAEDVAADSEE